jgi:hypothetical protein
MEIKPRFVGRTGNVMHQYDIRYDVTEEEYGAVREALVSFVRTAQEKCVVKISSNRTSSFETPSGLIVFPPLPKNNGRVISPFSFRHSLINGSVYCNLCIDYQGQEKADNPAMKRFLFNFSFQNLKQSGMIEIRTVQRLPRAS